MSNRTQALSGSFRLLSLLRNRSAPAAVVAALWLGAIPALAQSVSNPTASEARWAASAGAQDEAEEELAEERVALDRARRLGDRSALVELSQWVEDEPGDVALLNAVRDNHRFACQCGFQ